MYLLGAEHPHKHASAVLIQKVIQDGERIVTDAEVFQEILHRYTAIKRPEFIEPAFELLRKIVDEVFPIDIRVVESARKIVLSKAGLSAREALHVAAMEIHQVSKIASFDADFDRVPRITRLY